jgi:hypothetical protein
VHAPRPPSSQERQDRIEFFLPLGALGGLAILAREICCQENKKPQDGSNISIPDCQGHLRVQNSSTVEAEVKTENFDDLQVNADKRLHMKHTVIHQRIIATVACIAILTQKRVLRNIMAREMLQNGARN